MSPAPQPPPSPPSIYHIILGLSILTFGTISFGSYSLRLPAWPASLLESTHAGYPGTLGPPICPIPAAHQAPTCGLTPNLDEVTRLIHLLEVQVHELQDLTKQCITTMKDKSRRKSSTQSPEEYETMVGALATCSAMISTVVGLAVLDTALERISQKHWLRAITFGIMCANLGVAWALWIQTTWDRVTLFGLAGLNIGCAIGGVLAFGQTA